MVRRLPFSRPLTSTFAHVLALLPKPPSCVAVLRLWHEWHRPTRLARSNPRGPRGPSPSMWSTSVVGAPHRGVAQIGCSSRTWRLMRSQARPYPLALGLGRTVLVPRHRPAQHLPPHRPPARVSSGQPGVEHGRSTGSVALVEHPARLGHVAPVASPWAGLHQGPHGPLEEDQAVELLGFGPPGCYRPGRSARLGGCAPRRPRSAASCGSPTGGHACPGGRSSAGGDTAGEGGR